MASNGIFVAGLIIGIASGLLLVWALYRAVLEWLGVVKDNQHRLRPRVRDAAKKRTWVIPLLLGLKTFAFLAVIFVTNWAKLLAHQSPILGGLYTGWSLIVAISLFFIIPPSFAGPDIKSKIMPMIVIALSFFLLMAHSMAMYSGMTLNGMNAAKTLTYNGPARIVGYEADYSQGPAAARLVVTYGGAWACPENPDTYCEVLIDLDWCDRYDSTGMFANSNNKNRPWRTMNGQDMWDGHFTCANGFASNNGYNYNNAYNNGGNDGGNTLVYYDQDYRTYSADTAPQVGDNWPYQVNIFGDCSGACADGSVDSSITRDWIYRVERYKSRMGIGSIFGLLASSMAALAWWRHSKNPDAIAMDGKDAVLIQAGDSDLS